MGVIHKIKPEVIKFILDNKQSSPHLSCRNFTVLLLEKLQIKVSKSSINAIFKEHSLSMPVGRRQKLKKKKFNMPALPVIESAKTVMLLQEPEKSVPGLSLRATEGSAAIPTEIASSPAAPRNDYTVASPSSEEKIIAEQKKEKMRLEEERIKEAEAWALKLHEEELNRLEQERLRNVEAQREIEEEKLAREKEEVELRENESLRKAAEEKIKEEQARLQKVQQEEADKQKELARTKLEAEEKIKEEQARLQKVQQEEADKQKELARAKLEAEARSKEDKEKLVREAEVKAEQERWARLAEEGRKNAARVVKEGPELEVLSSLPSSRECTGVVLLKAMDYLLRGSEQLSEAIQERLGYAEKEVTALTQALIFEGIVDNDLTVLSSIVGKNISAERLTYYFSRLEELQNIKMDLSRMISNIFSQARGIKMHFVDGSVVYLDAQLHTVWSTPYTPYDFSATVATVKHQVNRYLFEDGNLVLFMAPGFDIPTKEFFSLLVNFNLKPKTVDNLILYGNKLEELGKIALNPADNRELSFGLWPWQFTAYRKVNRIGEFNLNRIDCMNKDFYLAEIEITLIQPTTKQSTVLKGCAIKLELAEKIRLVILSTNHTENLVTLANNYFCHWPNLDEGFQDFSRKMELFTYTGELQQFFAYENLLVAKSEPVGLKSVFLDYTETLDAYLRWHFMPSGYEKSVFPLMKERFYSQKAQLTQVKGKLHYSLVAAHGYAKELGYLCRRLNERDIRADNGQRVCFESAF